MLDLEEARGTALTNFGGLIERAKLASGDEWQKETRLPGWRVGDLVAHVAWGQSMEAEALRKTLAGNVTPAAGRPVAEGASREEVEAAAERAHAELTASFDAMTKESLGSPCPLPYTTVPAIFAIQIFAMEGAVHRNDLVAALDEPIPLPPEAISATIPVLTQMLPFMAASSDAQPEPGTTYVARGTTFELATTYRDGAWLMGESGSGPSCEIAGDDSSVTLFLLGRVGSDDVSINSSDPDLAARLKRYFPGP